MSTFGYSQRSKDAPMDFEWTNRDKNKSWLNDGGEDPRTPKKRTLEQVNTGTPINGIAGTPTFGRNQNVPFLFSPAPPAPQTPQGYPWMPPSQPEVRDVDMNEASPAKDLVPAKEEPETSLNAPEPDSSRPVAAGALRRVYNRRRRGDTRSRSRRAGQDQDTSDSESEGEEDGRVALRPKSTSNHYTLNMPAPAPPTSETPYVLLGYLQFFFNLSLILIFLYLAVQFILTVQRDVEKRISEYTQDIVQDIAMCATRYKQSFCGTQYVAPDMLSRCADWETCMNRDPTTIGRARVSAELIAEVINGFVEPISWKTLIFTLTSLGSMTVFVNTLLSLYRARYQPHAPVVPSSASYPLMTNAGYPSHPFGGFLPPAPASDWSRYKDSEPEDAEAPARRRRLEGGSSAKVK